ncbi:hypothetical protein K0A96_01880 [Patescibacteria group bacterium]|nr:hypothetical protein [Patescibacteria group bacterium]
MSEYYKDGRFLGELDDTPDDPDLKPHEQLYAYDALSSLTLDYMNQGTEAEKENFVLGLRKTLNLPDVSEESKKDIIKFLEKHKKGTLNN